MECPHFVFFSSDNLSQVQICIPSNRKIGLQSSRESGLRRLMIPDIPHTITGLVLFLKSH